MPRIVIIKHALLGVCACFCGPYGARTYLADCEWFDSDLSARYDYPCPLGFPCISLLNRFRPFPTAAVTLMSSKAYTLDNMASGESRVDIATNLVDAAFYILPVRDDWTLPIITRGGPYISNGRTRQAPFPTPSGQNLYLTYVWTKGALTVTWG
jgi:hypothetical protein